jgi:anti-sigma factor RsiW
MPCQEIVEAITEYLEGTLPEPDRTRFEKHLALCDPCVLYLEQMREMIKVLGKIDESSLAEEDKDELLILFRDWKVGSRTPTDAQ